MSDPDFWRHLADRFSELDPHRRLRADWDYIVGSHDPNCWRLVGSVSSVRIQFEALARRVASELPDATSPDLLIAWLEALRKESSSFQFGKELVERHADGTEGPHHLLGTIRNLGAASADYCTVLESRALQAAHLAKLEQRQRADPKHWSPVRQQWEAFKASKQLFSGPPEEVPELVLRNIIARAYGIEPEEVTLEQIRFEVSGLLQDYPRISIIPAQPVQDSAALPGAPAESEPRSNGDPVSGERSTTPKAMLDAYLAQFSEKVKILDICWAARQHYCDWKKWMREGFRAGSTPDRQFRAILSSDKHPHKYRKEPRPHAWR